MWQSGFGDSLRRYVRLGWWSTNLQMILVLCSIVTIIPVCGYYSENMWKLLLSIVYYIVAMNPVCPFQLPASLLKHLSRSDHSRSAGVQRSYEVLYTPHGSYCLVRRLLQYQCHWCKGCRQYDISFLAENDGFGCRCKRLQNINYCFVCLQITHI